MLERKPSAFTLVEVALALGIAAFCLVTLVGFLPVGMQSEKASNEETRAVNLVGAVIDDLRFSPVGGPSKRFALPDLPAAAATSLLSRQYFLSESETLSSQAGSRYALKITQYPVSSLDAREPLGVLVEVAWPASAPEDQRNRVETYATFLR